MTKSIIFYQDYGGFYNNIIIFNLEAGFYEIIGGGRG